MAVSRSSEGFLKHWWWTLYGPAKGGKTVAAASLSEFCPEELPHKGPPIFLEDVLFLEWDQNGTESLKPLGLDAPRIECFDATADMKSLTQKTEEMHKDITAEVAKGKIKTIIWDTLGTYLAAWDRFQADLTPPETNTSVYYKQIQNRMQRALDPLKKLPVNVLFVVHSKSNVAFMESKETQSERTRRSVDGLAGSSGAIFTLGLSSSASAYLKKQCSAIIPLHVENEKGKIQRFVLPNGGSGYEGGLRYPGLDAKEPAHLGLLVKKIKQMHGT